MEHYAGLDVSLDETSICIVDAEGRIIRETKVATDPAVIAAVLTAPGLKCRRVGLEAGPLSQWLFSGLAEAGVPVICIETRHAKAVLKAQTNKNDRNDARGIAQMMRVNLYRAVHVKTLQSQQLRMLLTSRKLLLNKWLDIENDLRGTLRNFGLRVGPVSERRFEARVLELVDGHPMVAAIAGPMLAARAALREQFIVLDKMLIDQARADPVCRLLITAPGVGPVVSMSFRAGVDIPQRFAKSRAVGPHFGMTPRQYQSGKTDWSGRITKCGDEMVRTALYEAAQVILRRTGRWCSLKAWGMKIAQRRGMEKAIVAVARRLGVILHRMWVDRTEFRWGKEPVAA